MSEMQKKRDLDFVLTENKVYHMMFNNMYLGKLYIEVDGFYVCSFAKDGVWSGWVLRTIAEKIEELNKPYIAQLIKDGLWS